MYFDFHLHSHYSNDSILSPEYIIKKALKKGFSGLAVTDHNTIKGAIKTKEISPNDFTVIVGSEIMTEKCEVIGLFLNEEISSSNFFEVIDEIKDQDGISILPHPFKGNFVDPVTIVDFVDLVEVLNARINPLLNMNARNLALKFNKIMSAGTDSHTPFEIGTIKNDLVLDSLDEESIRRSMLHGNINIVGKESSYPIRTLSKTVGRYRKGGFLGLSKSIIKKI